MRKILRFLILLAAMACTVTPQAQAKTVTFGEQPEKIEVRYGKATVLRFESKVGSVQNAEKFEIGPLNEQSPNYTEMSVRPRSTGSADTVNFLLVDGTVVRLHLVPVANASADSVETFYELKKTPQTSMTTVVRDPLPEGQGEEDDGDKIELMKALILGSKIRGYQIRSIDKPLKTGLNGVEAQLERVYAGKFLNGYVFKLTNTATQSRYEIDIRRLKIGEPNLALMAQVDRSVIEPEASGRNVAYLTIVALPSSLSRDVVLPVSWVKKEEARK